MNALKILFPALAKQIRRVIRDEIGGDIHRTLASHAATRQSLDLYEMRLETIDTRIARRILQLEARISRLEARKEALRPKQVA